jgi:hypothetical protein
VSGPNPKLLGDLARLAAKYKPKDWEDLARALDDQRQRETARALLLELAEVGRSRRKAAPRKQRKPSRATKIREQLAKIRKTDPGRADLLEDIWLKLRLGELLPTIAAIRAFADAMGSKGLKATRRDQAVTELMELLIKLPGDSLEQRMRQTVVEDRELGDEYEGWVRLILQRPGESAERP